MASKLMEIFNQCTWKTKYEGELPENSEEIRFRWREEDHEFAESFFSVGLFTEETPAVRRSIYIGEDETGTEVLCVREVTREDFDPKEIGKQFARLLDVSNAVRDDMRISSGDKDEK
ncbi:MAG: hypothetical protein ACOC0U_06920 [Desulfovibrionales bacterium]